MKPFKLKVVLVLVTLLFQQCWCARQAHGQVTTLTSTTCFLEGRGVNTKIEDLSKFVRETTGFLTKLLKSADSGRTYNNFVDFYNYTRSLFGLDYSISDEVEFTRAITDIALSVTAALSGSAKVDLAGSVSRMKQYFKKRENDANDDSASLREVRTHLGYLVVYAMDNTRFSGSQSETKQLNEYLSSLTLGDIGEILGLLRTKCPPRSDCPKLRPSIQIVELKNKTQLEMSISSIIPDPLPSVYAFAFTDKLPYLDFVSSNFEVMIRIDLSSCSSGFVQMLRDEVSIPGYPYKLLVKPNENMSAMLFVLTPLQPPVDETTADRYPRQAVPAECDVGCENGGTCVKDIGVCRCVDGYGGPGCTQFTCRCAETTQVCVGPNQCSGDSQGTGSIGTVVAAPIVIGVGILILVAVVIGLACYLVYKKRQLHKREREKREKEEQLRGYS